MGRGRFKVSRQLIENFLKLPNDAFVADMLLDSRADAFDVYVESPDIKGSEGMVVEVGYYITKNDDGTFSSEFTQANAELAKQVE